MSIEWRAPHDGEDLTGKAGRVKETAHIASEHLGRLGILEPYKYGRFHWYLVDFDGRDGLALYTDELEVSA